MKGTKHLSELVNDKIQFNIDSLNVIEAPTGCGKTYFALDYFPHFAKDSAHNILYLIDTRNGLEQMVAYYDNAKREYPNWIEEVNGEYALVDWNDNNDDVVVLTYAKFGIICDKRRDFQDRFDYIICDELPSLIKYQNYSVKPNCHSIAKDSLETAVMNDHTVVIALTATPNALNNGFPHILIHSVYIDKEQLITYDTPKPLLYSKIDEVIKSLDTTKVGLCYTAQVHPMLQIQELAEDVGLKPICIWSINYDKIKMNEEQLRVRDEILNNFRIPPEYNFLIINAACETSIKIKEPAVDYVIVHNTNADTQTQVRGRVSNDISAYYLPTTRLEDSDFLSVKVPAEYLGVKLFSEDKDRLCSLLNLRNPNNNRQYRWTSIKEFLCNSGYAVAEGRENNLRYNVITIIE